MVVNCYEYIAMLHDLLALLVGDVAVTMAVARYKWKDIKLQAFFTFLFAALILYSYQFLFINCINTFVQLSYTIFRLSS